MSEMRNVIPVDIVFTIPLVSPLPAQVSNLIVINSNGRMQRRMLHIEPLRELDSIKSIFLV